MRYETLCKLERITDALNTVNHGIGMVLGAIIFGPFYLIIKGWEWCREDGLFLFRKHILRKNIRSRKEKEEFREKLGTREIEMGTLPHSPEKARTYNSRIGVPEYFFYEERKHVIPITSVVYVENVYNEKMHQFFDRNKDKLDKWIAWHGWNIEFIDKDLIKEDMFFPQDYDTEFKHGFLWSTGTASWDPEYKVFGAVHCYFEINPTSDEEILAQMNAMMSKIYYNFDTFLI